MIEDWKLETLGDLVEAIANRVGAADIAQVLSVTEKRGIIPQEEVFKKRIATVDLSNYKVLQPLDIAYNPYLLWTGAIGQWLGDRPGATSPVYECFRARPHVDPRFLGLIVESGVLTPYFDSTAVGSIQRRRRTTPEVFCAARVLVPPLSVQRRIVDLMAHLDDHLANVRAEAAAGSALSGPLFEAVVDGDGQGVSRVTLGVVGEFIRGRRFTKDEYVPAGLGCIHYGQVHTHFGPVAERCLTYLPEDARSRLRLAHPGDVVVAATSEDLSGLGRATAWMGEGDVAVHDDCYIYRHRLDPKFAAYLFASPSFQAEKRLYAGGTKVTRISGADLARVLIRIPSAAAQREIGQTLYDLSRQVTALRTEIAALEGLRHSLLVALLSRESEISASYDSLIPQVT